MRQIALVATMLGALVVPHAAAASLAHPDDVTGGAGARSPKLRIVSANPLVVAGSGFEARERVTLTTLTSLGPRILRIRATPDGRFRGRLGVFTQPCGKPFAVRARGAGGSVAMLRLETAPCVPPPIR